MVNYDFDFKGLQTYIAEYFSLFSDKNKNKNNNNNKKEGKEQGSRYDTSQKNNNNKSPINCFFFLRLIFFFCREIKMVELANGKEHKQFSK